MAVTFRVLVITLAATTVVAATATRAGSASPAHGGGSLLQAWGRELDKTATGSNDTPVTRVVKLLKEMSATLKKEQEEDEALYDKLACWCNNNNYEKSQAIEASEAKISELTATIEELTAKSAELESSIKELEAEVAANKKALAEATALREKQAKEFHGAETDSIQAIENLKAALTVLAKHHGSGTESTVAGGPVFKSESDSWALLQSKKDTPWSEVHESMSAFHSLDDFMRKNGFDDPLPEQKVSTVLVEQPHSLRKVQNGSPAAASWSMEEAGVVRRALKSASAFVQAHHLGSYYPAYSAQSGQIVGVLKELKEEMEGDLGESQKREQARAAAFAELRAAKEAEIESGEKMAEQKEDELATAKNNLAEAKEDLEHEEASLQEDQKFLKNLKETCADASTNFDQRKNARLQEIQAVSEAIEILTGDEARDAMSGTYNFLQTSASVHADGLRRSKAAQVLRQVAKATKDPQLSVLATAVELDAFTRVKKAIDDMVAMLKVQQEDEVKKNDYCKAELQENEMTTAKQTDYKASLEAKASALADAIATLEQDIAAANAQISQLQLELQRASEDRKIENLDFQKTVADQAATVEVLKMALERLAAYYSKESLIQGAKMVSRRQTPPVPQMEYKKSAGATGVMEMLEKLIQEAKGMIKDARKSESEAQAAYEQTVGDTNDSVAALQQEIASKTKAKVDAHKEKLQTESDIADTESELEGLAKYNSELHAECDYILKNFDARQAARGQEIEALQQAKQILSGASLS